MVVSVVSISYRETQCFDFLAPRFKGTISSDWIEAWHTVALQVAPNLWMDFVPRSFCNVVSKLYGIIGRSLKSLVLLIGCGGRRLSARMLDSIQSSSGMDSYNRSCTHGRRLTIRQPLMKFRVHLQPTYLFWRVTSNARQTQKYRNGQLIVRHSDVAPNMSRHTPFATQWRNT